jgi:hypothetical protein
LATALATVRSAGSLRFAIGMSRSALLETMKYPPAGTATPKKFCPLTPTATISPMQVPALA